MSLTIKFDLTEAIQSDVWTQALTYHNLKHTPNNRQETPEDYLNRIDLARVSEHLLREQGSPRRNKIAEAMLAAIAAKQCAQA